MAYAAVASLSQTIDLVLVYHQGSISPHFRNQIISLHQHIIFFQSFLEGGTVRTNNWEETIREVTDRAEVIVELILSDFLLEPSAGSSESKFEKGDYDGSDDLQNVAEEIESIANRVKGKHVGAASGSDEGVMKIISQLRGGSSALETVAAVGMGGIGKTTMARNAFNNPLVVEHFDVRVWLKVSSCTAEQQIAMNLLRSASNSEDVPIESVYGILQGGKRYLTVLDDVCSAEFAGRLKSLFPNNGNGSRIILTSRLSDVAAASDHVHEMRLLDEDKTWDLLREIVLKGDPCPSELESTGKVIAKHCRGHPPTVLVVSRILGDDQTEAAWEDVSDSIQICSPDPADMIYLSYTYLPHRLKACYLYFGIFYQQEEVRVSKLIKLWVAEGFLNQDECKSFEETGEECVEDLVNRNLVWVKERKSNGRIKSVVMHDLMWLVSKFQAREDNFNLRSPNLGRASAMELRRLRRASNLSYGDDIFKGFYGLTLRSMFFGNDGQLGIRCSVANVRLLRILDFSNAYYLNLPEEVFELFHLRYLAFDCWFSVSEAISNLQNLQTLIVCSKENGRMFDKLPEGIWRLPQLRHLSMFRLELPGLKGGTSALENLQTLSEVVDFVCSRENLKMIPNLKKLAIFYTNKSSDVVEDYELHNLIHLQKLETLKIGMDCSLVDRRKMSRVFPPTLKKLNLCGLKLPWEDMKIFGSLPNLEVLKLRNHACIGGTWETGEGGFSRLTFLLIDESDLKNWITEASHFPKLRCLIVLRCSELVVVPIDLGSGLVSPIRKFYMV